MAESQIIEWKTSWQDKYLKWICGFANAQGGELVIGKDDSGNVVGINNAKKLMEDIPNQVRDLMGIIIEVNLHEHNDLEYIAIHVDAHPYPVNLHGAYHLRSGTTKQELKGAALDQFLLMKKGKHWDGVPIPHFKAEDCSLNALSLFRSKAVHSRRLSDTDIHLPVELLLEKLHLYDGEYLKRAAILLFHLEPQKYVTGAYVKIGYFESDADLLYQDEIHGDLFTQVDRTLDLLQTKYSHAIISYKGSQRVETQPVPEAALRESIINAIVHKDYALGVPIQISVYEDRLWIWNPGRLPDSWSLDTLWEKHSSIPYNPDIANAFFRAGLIESWGRGIEKICQSCVNHGLPKPTFSHEQGGMWTRFELFKSKPDNSKPKPVKSKPTKSSATDIADALVVYLADNPTVSIKAIAAQFNRSHSTIERTLRSLKAQGLIDRIGSTKSGYWQVNIGNEND